MRMALAFIWGDIEAICCRKVLSVNVSQSMHSQILDFRMYQNVTYLMIKIPVIVLPSFRRATLAILPGKTQFLEVTSAGRECCWLVAAFIRRRAKPSTAWRHDRYITTWKTDQSIAGMISRENIILIVVHLKKDWCYAWFWSLKN